MTAIDLPFSPNADLDMRIYAILPIMVDSDSTIGRLLVRQEHIKRAAYGFLPEHARLDRAHGTMQAPFLFRNGPYSGQLITRGNR